MGPRQFACVVVLLACVGCGPREEAPPPGPTPTMAPAPSTPLDRPEPAAQTAPPAEPGAYDPAVAEPAVEPPTGDQPADPQAAAPETERVAAEKGVGLKGRSLDEHEGVIVTPAKTYFTVRERIIFEVTVPNNMKLFEATHGRLPRSHEEFMAEVIEANNVLLPQLPPGQRYVYDPEVQELMVERPQR